MNQRLIWNFEFSSEKGVPLPDFKPEPEAELKWEARFFWSEDQIITLNLIDISLSDISSYKQKQKDDIYYVLPHHEYNLKRRHQELLYKPLHEKTPYALGFGSKIKIDEIEDNINQIRTLVGKEGKEIQVKKVSYIYKFPTEPRIKLELSRIEVLHKIYFSVCIEGRSRFLVETISEHLLGKPVSCDYVSFLKTVK